MATEVKVPVLPESVSDATIASWHKKAGDSVKRDENLVDLETDKVVLEVPSPVDGVLKEIKFSEGDTVTSQQVLAIIEEGAVAEAAPAEGKKAEEPKAEAPKAEAPAKAAAPAPAAKAGGAELLAIPESVLATVPEYMKQVTRGAGTGLVWPALLRKMDRLDPGYRE